MSDYWDGVDSEAFDFVLDSEDEIKEFLESGDGNPEYRFGRDDSFHEQIIDQIYSLNEAIDVINHTHNEETDTGLWDGQQPEQALCSKAAWSHGQDVWEKCGEYYVEIRNLYDLAKEQIDNMVLDLDDEIENCENEKEKESMEMLHDLFNENIEEVVFMLTWTGFRNNEGAINIYTKGSNEEIKILNRWLTLYKDNHMTGFVVGMDYLDYIKNEIHPKFYNIKTFLIYDYEIVLSSSFLKGKTYEEVEEYMKTVSLVNQITDDKFDHEKNDLTIAN